MAIDKTALTKYVELQSKEIATNAVAKAATAAYLISSGNVQVGIKTEAPILVGDADVVLQSGASCGRVASGNFILSDKTIKVTQLADKQDWCPKDMVDTYYRYAIGAGSQPDAPMDSGFASYFMDLRVKKIAAANEKLLWRGDSSISGTSNLKWFDGILKQVASDAVNVNSGETELVDKLADAFLKNDVDVSAEDDYRVWMGKDTFNRYLAALKKRNIYQPVDDMNLYGTTGTIFIAPGLNGTDKVLFGRTSNIRLGMDGTGEDEKATLKYSLETEKWYVDIFYALGIKVIFPSEIGILDLNGTPVSSTTTTTTTIG